MHRVELKEVSGIQFSVARISFLMHRVELKGVNLVCISQQANPVPNAPCGVERS